MPRLKDFEGQTVTLIMLSPHDPTGLQQHNVKLVAVEDVGIWIED